jgi:cytochrome c peroxidase
MVCRGLGVVSLGVISVLGLVAVAIGRQQPAPAATAEAPKGLPPLPVPKDNPMTPVKIELGKMLYFDKRLSKDESVSCATCHDPKTAWAENKPTSTGIHKQVGERNAPTVINAAHMQSMFWDGRMKTLEEQALGPIENPIEMGMDMELVVENLKKVPEYQKRFKEVFGTDVTKEGIAQAIAAFERTVASGDSPYDRYEAGDKNVLSQAQKRGMEIFMGSGQCSTCHAPPLFSNSRFYNAGVDAHKAKPDDGRKKVTNNEKDMGAFRVPHLRNVAETHPFFHDGSAPKLEDAVKLMAAGGKDNANLSPILKSVREAKLTDENVKDLVEFLKALSGKYPVIEPPKLP